MIRLGIQPCTGFLRTALAPHRTRSRSLGFRSGCYRSVCRRYCAGPAGMRRTRFDFASFFCLYNSSEVQDKLAADTAIWRDKVAYWGSGHVMEAVRMEAKSATPCPDLQSTGYGWTDASLFACLAYGKPEEEARIEVQKAMVVAPSSMSSVVLSRISSMRLPPTMRFSLSSDL